ncbi:hypothetical protein B0H13DRAFT_1956427 [Mycena leptocephala]|nr:hypothetical protein B0H13DRAFT_1956427 [Mycena leptocephala]
MRHFKSSQFPNRDAYSVSLFVFNKFPMDIGLAILEHCSPSDLVQLEIVSKGLRAFIRSNMHLWTAALGNVSRGECPGVPSLPVVEASGNYSQSAYALFIFGGGSCSWCSKWTELQPFQWIFRFRACSVSQRLLSLGQYDDHSWGKWLPRMMRIQQSGDIIHVYSTRATKYATRELEQAFGVDRGNSRRDPLGFPCRTVAQLKEECAKRERSRPALHRNGLQLEEWQKRYVQQKSIVFCENFEFIKCVSAVENKKHQGILRCPTMARIFAAFNRDLALITETVWRENLPIIRAEFKYMVNGVLPDGMVGRRNDKVRCSYCPRLIKTQGPESGSDEKHCPECPDLKRLSRSEVCAITHYTSKLPSKYSKAFLHTFVDIPSRIHASSGRDPFYLIVFFTTFP